MSEATEQERADRLIRRIEASKSRNSAIMAREDFRDEYDAIPAPQRCRVLKAMALRER